MLGVTRIDRRKSEKIRKTATTESLLHMIRKNDQYRYTVWARMKNEKQHITKKALLC